MTQPRPAGLGIRLGSRLIDLVFGALIMAAGNFAILIVAAIIDGAESENWGAALAVNMIVAPILYEWIQLALYGKTLGKRVLGLHVVRTDGSPLSWSLAGVRALLNAPYVSYLLLLFILPLINLAFMLADSSQRRGMHSRATDTLVMDVRPRIVYPPAPMNSPAAEAS
ncbi:RDD family protein [Nocardia sp. 2]|uniref:RDD family protein n=1 Tax=Nocardia acididurans TaxID=2802282 RepID=A0ABS1MAL9_9NOCA|nr:RDD family protein [Nocardia acididurans]MBL1077299.1 RDD family protein [Nocardia acididurans]